MHASISAFHPSETCTWCEKSAECVTVEFDGGFLKKTPLCFRCLQQTIRVQHKQSGGAVEYDSVQDQKK